jgi:drug/metabolite transporter (DMT)-like permease
MNTPQPHPLSLHNETRGLWLGLLGVVIFAMTLPMTRLAVGPASAPQLTPEFVTAGRAALAGLLSALYLAFTKAPRPQPRHFGVFGVCALGTVVGFPLFLGLALRQVDAMHAAVVSGLMPLSTAVLAALYLRQRPSTGFWLCAVLGCLMVLTFAAYQGGGSLLVADGFLFLAVLSAAVSYVAGSALAQHMKAEHVICWVLVISLPLTLPAMLWLWPTRPVQPSAWGGFAYVTLFSMWLGFFAWYRGLALGGTIRVSQVQLVQPFLALLFAVPVLGEKLKLETVLFSLGVMAVVLLSKKMPVRRALLA